MPVLHYPMLLLWLQTCSLWVPWILSCVEQVLCALSATTSKARPVWFIILINVYRGASPPQLPSLPAERKRHGRCLKIDFRCPCWDEVTHALDSWLPRHREINSKEMLPPREVPWAGVRVYILTGQAEYPTTNLAVMVESPFIGAAALMILTQPIYWPAVVLNIKMKAWWKSPLFSWGSLFGIPCHDDSLFLLQSMGWKMEMLCPCCYPNTEGTRILARRGRGNYVYRKEQHSCCQLL